MIKKHPASDSPVWSWSSNTHTKTQFSNLTKKMLNKNVGLCRSHFKDTNKRFQRSKPTRTRGKRKIHTETPQADIQSLCIKRTTKTNSLFHVRMCKISMRSNHYFHYSTVKLEFCQKVCGSVVVWVPLVWILYRVLLLSLWCILPCTSVNTGLAKPRSRVWKLQSHLGNQCLILPNSVSLVLSRWSITSCPCVCLFLLNQHLKHMIINC